MLQKNMFVSISHNQATLKKKSVSCRPGGTNKNHPGGREILFFFRNIFFLVSFRDHSAYIGENRLKIGRKMTEILKFFKKKKKKNAAG